MKIKVEIIGKSDIIIKKLLLNNIFYDNYVAKKEIVSLIIDKSNYKILQLYFGENIKIVKYYGKEGLLFFLRREYIFLLSFLFGLVILLLLSNTIFFIEINTNDKELKNIISSSLEGHKIKKYYFKKSYKELTVIKNEIKNENKDVIEWIEIREIGTKYIVELTPRVIKKAKENDNTIQSIVALKEGLIMHITSSSGEVIKEVGEYVKKGEEIISGNIYKNEKTLSKQVKALGKVYAEVWYIINTTVPYEYVEYVKTGEVINHYYLKFPLGKKMTLLGKYDTTLSMNEKYLVVDKPYLPFKVYKEKKELYEYRTNKISSIEAKDEAIRRSTIALNNKLDKGEYIIDKKVLKIKEFSSKINVEIFYKVYENITDTIKLNKIVE